MDTDGSLSEIAKSVLADHADGDPKSFREKAGLLALLNLLGIVESFYGEMPLPLGVHTRTPPTHDPAVASLIEAQPEPTAPSVPAAGPAARPQAATTPGPAAPGPVSIVSGLTKLIGSVQPATTADGSPTQSNPTIANLLAGIDPSIIAGILSMVASMAKPRLARAPVKVEAQSSEDAPSESGEIAAEPEPSPEAAPPSPLQMLLGIDPKVLTLALNVLAELMKAKQTEAKEKPAEGQAGEADPVAKQASRETRTSQVIPTRKAYRMHRPGLGIYRSPLVAPKPENKGQNQIS